jgi:hypothetical protein
MNCRIINKKLNPKSKEEKLSEQEEMANTKCCQPYIVRMQNKKS